jgi:hypothetical protein
MKKYKIKCINQVPVTHSCNPSYFEAEIERITVHGQPEQIVHETPSPK